ncbi:MAG: hypothetical protein N2654_03685 [Deltaproteobacteria bacterium]|nr:hypothetical protein [Deltaproteobacteria bacterium]
MNEHGEVSLTLWKPDAYLEKIPSDAVKFSGIINYKINPDDIILLKQEFLYLFECFGLKLETITYKVGLNGQPPKGLTKYFHCCGINAVVIPDSSKDVLEGLFLGTKTYLSDIFVEYLIRRFVYYLSLSSSKVFSGSRFLGRNPSKGSELPVNVTVNCQISGKSFSFHILLSREFALRLVDEEQGENKDTKDNVTRFPVYLCFLLIPVTDLEEYLKPDTVIDLEIPVTSKAYLRLKNNEAVIGTLVNVDGYWGFRPSSKEAFLFSNTQHGKAMVFIEIFSIDSASISKDLNLGRVLVSDKKVSPQVDIYVGSSRAKTGKIYFYEQNLALVVD